MSVYFDVKDPAEDVVLTFDFSLDLPTGVTLSSVQSVSVVTFAGTDPSPANVLNGLASLDTSSTKVLQPVTGGLAGCVYEIVIRVATTNPYMNLVWVAMLPVAR